MRQALSAAGGLTAAGPCGPAHTGAEGAGRQVIDGFLGTKSTRQLLAGQSKALQLQAQLLQPPTGQCTASIGKTKDAGAVPTRKGEGAAIAALLQGQRQFLNPARTCMAHWGHAHPKCKSSGKPSLKMPLKTGCRSGSCLSPLHTDSALSMCSQSGIVI